MRWAIPNDLAALYPAALAMFTEEVGVSPLETSTEAAYRARLMWLIRQRRVLCRTDRHGVIFKAEIAAVTPHACQIQGVWCAPTPATVGSEPPRWQPWQQRRSRSPRSSVSTSTRTTRRRCAATGERVHGDGHDGLNPPLASARLAGGRQGRGRRWLTADSRSKGAPVLLRMSSLFLRTLREDPADAEVPSHRLLVRAGYVRRVAPGIFSWLPLGVRVLRRVEDVVRAHMDGAGFQEVHFPALLPRDLYEVTGRWEEYGDTLFRLQDRRQVDYLLGPTHEEMFTDLVKGSYSSYKDLPVSLYQIQTKYRDEARPRAGILRGREFVMKDSYSFDLTDEGLEISYAQHRRAYEGTFAELGLEYVIVSAQSRCDGRVAQ